ncbi:MULTISPECIES: muramidase family protein [Acinetobacter]|uniref:muramidase family protein n=1 Tax=Acinetobacter TaxID=469 RepID=UPI000CAF32CE|nr:MULTISPECIES: LysM peptidoglycan-binding domain-containing protein [Acinetobacter]MDI3239219.1 LysM peptidoglycan-binding domain-containing protein [Acinetobacter ursingii]MEC6127636.1 LysM peptidoglycan-binding domain-containing protein [Acinetobacter ursingii]PMC96183.1 LysM domain-containing protein [Acinetobacter ursingii]PZT87554.1 MAG: LysM domain-containing protein [Acinetobacter sp.]
MKKLLMLVFFLINCSPIAANVQSNIYDEYTVKAGDTLHSIAKAHNTSYEEVAKDNNLQAYKITVGQTLKLPKALNNTEYESLIIQSTPKCSSREDCDTKMEAANLWVSKNADYKIRSANSVLIETYAPREFKGDIIVSIAKESTGEKGNYAIVATMSCGNPSMFKGYNPMTSCKRNVYRDILKFNEFVNSY